MKIAVNIMVIKPKKLPVFMGYTLDFRLKEFRKFNLKYRTIEFINFESEKGKRILKKYYNSN